MKKSISSQPLLVEVLSNSAVFQFYTCTIFSRQQANTMSSFASTVLSRLAAAPYALFVLASCRVIHIEQVNAHQTFTLQNSFYVLHVSLSHAVRQIFIIKTGLFEKILKGWRLVIAEKLSRRTNLYEDECTLVKSFMAHLLIHTPRGKYLFSYLASWASVYTLAKNERPPHFAVTSVLLA